jgi:hypothetical protein
VKRFSNGRGRRASNRALGSSITQRRRPRTSNSTSAARAASGVSRCLTSRPGNRPRFSGRRLPDHERRSFPQRGQMTGPRLSARAASPAPSRSFFAMSHIALSMPRPR